MIQKRPKQKSWYLRLMTTKGKKNDKKKKEIIKDKRNNERMGKKNGKKRKEKYEILEKIKK